MAVSGILHLLHQRRHILPVAVLTGLTASFAPGIAAALTPAEVWAEMQRIARESGQVPRAAAERSDADELILEGVTITAGTDSPNRATTLIDSIGLSPLTSDSVAITYGGGYQIEFESTAAAGLDRAVLDLQTENLVATATGRTGDITFDYRADTAALRLSEFTAQDGSEIPEFLLSASDLSLTSQYVGAQNRVQATAESLSFELEVRGPEGAGTMATEFRMTRPEIDSTGSPLALSNAQDLESILTADIPYAIDIRHAGMALGATAVVQGVSSGFAASATGGSSQSKLESGVLSLAGTSEGVAFQVQTDRLPAPLSAETDRLALAVTLPLVTDDEAAPVSLSAMVEALSLGEDVWALFDPGAHLPRDPMHLEIDLDGLARISETGFASAMPGTSALDLEQLTLRTLSLRAAGATLEGEGQVLIDRTRPGPVPGMPGLVGQFGLAASGVEGLLSALAAAGLLQSSDTMALRMMMSMLARPGPSPDTMTSQIELTEDGGVVANGMRLR